MSIPTAPSCRFTSSASRSYGASGGTRQVNRNRVPESSDAAAAGSNLKVAASRGIAQLRGQIGPVDATPYEFSAFLTTASRLTARFNARRIAADLSCGASGFKTMTYWYRRVNVNNEIEFAFSREGRASGPTSQSISVRPRSISAHAVRTLGNISTRTEASSGRPR
jgi:hypothetical protein